MPMMRSTLIIFGSGTVEGSLRVLSCCLLHSYFALVFQRLWDGTRVVVCPLSVVSERT